VTTEAMSASPEWPEGWERDRLAITGGGECWKILSLREPGRVKAGRPEASLAGVGLLRVVARFFCCRS